MNDAPTRKPKGPGRLSAEDTARLEARIVDASEQVFLSEGFARATMDGIAKAAGVTRKTLYARYGGKADAFSAVVGRLLEAEFALRPLKARLEEGARPVLRELAAGVIAFVENPHMAGLNRLLFAEGARTPEIVRASTELYEREIAAVRQVLEGLRDNGALRALPDPRLAAMMFIELVSSTPRMRAVLGPAARLSRSEVDAYTEAAVDLFIAGCAARAAT